MKKRTIELSLDKAREWYKQGGDLKEVALQAFKEEELCDVIIRKVGNFVHVKGNGEDFCIWDIPDFFAKWDDALDLAKTFHFSLPTKSQLELAWKHRDEINKHLNHPFCNDGWYWTNGLYSAYTAWYLRWTNGTLNNSYKNNNNRVRAFAALPL